MISELTKERIAILGGGPSALFVYKRFVESRRTDIEIAIHEAKQVLGAGMPYGYDGANVEHVTNVSDKEIPNIVTSIHEWVQIVPDSVLRDFDIDKNRFNEYKVLPRLLFGQYLSDQFSMLLAHAEKIGLKTIVHLSSRVADIIDNPETGKVEIEVEGSESFEYDRVIICTGHNWPTHHEGTVDGYFDSPYPPSKLKLNLNHAVAIRGSSLTAIDAIRTLARSNGQFSKAEGGQITYHVNPDSKEFKMVLHSRNGLLPAIRFHLEEPLLSKDDLLSKELLDSHIAENGGFLSLDYVFEKAFKDLFKEKDPEFYSQIKEMGMEEFVANMMDKRERKDSFELFRAEYIEAEISLKQKASIHWKEMLAVLSFAMNYPAKYLSAEDTTRMQKVLMPLISIVIAFAPQVSAQELLALHREGYLQIVSVGDENTIEPQSHGGIVYHFKQEDGKENSQYYRTFVDCTGQPHLKYDAFPYKTLVKSKAVSPARIRYRSANMGQSSMEQNPDTVEQDHQGEFYLKVSGITINDSFQVIGEDSRPNTRIYIMAVPYIGGYNPDYSGLDFCEQASEIIVKDILQEEASEMKA